MKNQYAGDIGDYTKIGILKAIEKHFSLGINWYLTPNDKRTDGKFTTAEYIKEPDIKPDKKLFDILKEISKKENRQVKYLESNISWINTTFYSKNFQNPKERDKWHKGAMEKLAGKEIIFCDPDNGLEVKSIKPKSKNGNKYTTYQEFADYYKSGASVIVYNHRDRKLQEEYLKRFTKFKEIEETADAKIFYLRASKFSVRDYLFVVHEQHFPKLEKVIDEFLNTEWHIYLTKYYF